MPNIETKQSLPRFAQVFEQSGNNLDVMSQRIQDPGVARTLKKAARSAARISQEVLCFEREPKRKILKYLKGWDQDSREVFESLITTIKDTYPNSNPRQFVMKVLKFYTDPQPHNEHRNATQTLFEAFINQDLTHAEITWQNALRAGAIYCLRLRRFYDWACDESTTTEQIRQSWGEHLNPLIPFQTYFIKFNEEVRHRLEGPIKAANTRKNGKYGAKAQLKKMREYAEPFLDQTGDEYFIDRIDWEHIVNKVKKEIDPDAVMVDGRTCYNFRKRWENAIQEETGNESKKIKYRKNNNQ